MADMGARDFDSTELRGNVPRSFMALLDACAQADGLGRVELVMRIVEPELQRRVHAARMLCRMVGCNPDGSDAASECGPKGRG